MEQDLRRGMSYNYKSRLVRIILTYVIHSRPSALFGPVKDFCRCHDSLDPCTYEVNE